MTNVRWDHTGQDETCDSCGTEVLSTTIYSGLTRLFPTNMCGTVVSIFLLYIKFRCLHSSYMRCLHFLDCVIFCLFQTLCVFDSFLGFCWLQPPFPFLFSVFGNQALNIKQKLTVTTEQKRSYNVPAASRLANKATSAGGN